MKEEILSILNDIRSDIDFENETSLIDGSLIDSFDVVALAGELMDRYDIQISVEHLAPENFNSVDAIVALVEKLMQE